MTKLAPYLKSLVAALIAGLASLQQALDGPDQHVTSSEWVSVAVAFFVALGAVFAIPNRDPQALHQDESVQPPEAGFGGLMALGAVMALGGLLIWLLTLADVLGIILLVVGLIICVWASVGSRRV